MEALIATAQYKLYYIDAGGATVEVSDCTPDTDKVFAIVEKFDACTVALDYEKQTATPQSALVYANEANSQVQVRGRWEGRRVGKGGVRTCRSRWSPEQ